MYGKQSDPYDTSDLERKVSDGLVEGSRSTPPTHERFFLVAQVARGFGKPTLFDFHTYCREEA